MSEKRPADLHESVDRILGRITTGAVHFDPLLDPDLSRLHTRIAAALTHHGFLLQNSLRDALRESRFLTIIDQPEVFIAPMVDEFVQRQPIEACLNSQLAYEPSGRRLRPDQLVLDHRDNSATFYEVRRAASPRGSGHWRRPIQDTLALRVLAASYARNLGYRVALGSAYLIAYYGGHKMPSELVIDRTGLDDHFGFPVMDRIEAETSHYQAELRRILPLPSLVLEWMGRTKRKP